MYREIQQASVEARNEEKEIQQMQVLTHVMAFMIGGTVGITALALLMAGRDDR